MDIERNLLLQTVVSQRSHLDDVLVFINSEKIFKDAEYSEQLRKDSIALYLQKNHDAEIHKEIFNYCSQSIAWAPPEHDEELALAYENRSVFLLHMHKYKECIEDIDRALKITTSDVLKVKLFCHKAECLKKLGSLECQVVLETAETYLSKLDEQSITEIIELLNRVKACPITNVNDKEPNIVDEIPHVDKLSNCISISHNEKYGRCVNAKKNYAPGDCIFVEKLFACVLNPDMNHSHCNYCLKICWSGIPCNYCNWAMFCTEDCKQKGWTAFHDIECSVVPYLKEVFSNFFESASMSLRILLVGIREAGSIDELLKKLKFFDECEDTFGEGFYDNEPFSVNLIQSIFSLKNDGIPNSKLEMFASGALVVLMSLVKHSNLIENFRFNQIDDIIANENLVFLGSLLIKITAIENNNTFSLTHKNCDCLRLKNQGEERNNCCERGYCLSPIASLLNHSCYPNATMCFTENQQIIIYALLPIKKSSQIFITYAGFYYNKSLEDRKRQLIKYNFTCDCQACIESWPALLLEPLGERNFQLKTDLEKEVYKDCTSIFMFLGTKRTDFKKKDLEKLSKSIMQLPNKKQLSLLVTLLIEALGTVFSSIYGLKSPNFHFTQNCNY